MFNFFVTPIFLTLHKYIALSHDMTPFVYCHLILSYIYHHVHIHGTYIYLCPYAHAHITYGYSLCRTIYLSTSSACLSHCTTVVSRVFNSIWEFQFILMATIRDALRQTHCLVREKLRFDPRLCCGVNNEWHYVLCGSKRTKRTPLTEVMPGRSKSRRCPRFQVLWT
jgi:hypothetical protein